MGTGLQVGGGDQVMGMAGTQELVAGFEMRFSAWQWRRADEGK